MGYDETVTLEKDGKVSLSVFKVNERQFIEIFPERTANSSRIYHFAVETTSLKPNTSQ